MLQKRVPGAIKQFQKKKYQGGISVSANLWPSFSAFIFALGGSIVIENEDYSTKVVVSPIGRIRKTAV